MLSIKLTTDGSGSRSRKVRSNNDRKPKAGKNNNSVYYKKHISNKLSHFLP
jgi:hypothetical protein